MINSSSQSDDIELNVQANRHTTISAKVADAVIDGLYEGRISPGQRLVENDLMRRFQVSRSTIRESLNRLEAQGVVEMTRHKGACIRMLSRREAQDTIRVFRSLNGLLARLVAENIGAPEARKSLQMAFEALQQTERQGSYLESILGWRIFNRELLRVADNSELIRLYSSNEVHLIRVQFQVVAIEYAQERDTYVKRMMDAIIAGEPDVAELYGFKRTDALQRQLQALPDIAFRIT